MDNIMPSERVTNVQLRQVQNLQSTYFHEPIKHRRFSMADEMHPSLNVFLWLVTKTHHRLQERAVLVSSPASVGKSPSAAF